MSTAVTQRVGGELALSPNPPPGSPHQNTARTDSGRQEGTNQPKITKIVLPQEEDRESPLPELKSSDRAIDKRKPLPTSLQSEFIPEDILLALTQIPQPTSDQLAVPSKTKSSASKGMAAPANVWNFPNRRKRFQHLTEQPQSWTGAGRDISFLYDITQEVPRPPPNDPFDKSSIRASEKFKDPSQEKKGMSLPDTLIPEEYHIVKSKGVQGLEFHDEKFTTQVTDVDKNLTIFPSMKPASRYEVVQLTNVMDDMLQKAGIDDEELEVRGPTQMHNLLQLIKKEQNIYNIVFHELIRQVSVECAERGSLLANLRERYSKLLDKVPRQVKSLHQEVMAQRALDRRLTEELLRFKTNISELTSELSDVREHDKLVTMQAAQAQEDLKSALTESEKNAGLLAEYHELYELQRKRLEQQVTSLKEERELWSNASYSLALKVTEANSLATARRIHVTEKSWSKLATHFTIVLSDKDTEEMSTLQGFVDKFRDLIASFYQHLKNSDKTSRDRLKQVRAGIERWIEEFTENVIGMPPDYAVRPPVKESVDKLYEDIRLWEETINKEVEKFGGDILLSFEDNLYQINKQMEGWTETAVKIFSRHLAEDGGEFPAHNEMLKMNKSVEALMSLLKVRVNGENGVAKGFITLQNAMEVWDTKLTQVVNGAPYPPESEWGRLYDLFEDWIVVIDETLSIVGSTQKEEDRHENKPHNPITMDDVFRIAQKWLTTTTNGVDNEDSKLFEQVHVLHSEMVHWMIQVLLRLAPDKEGNPQEAIESSMAATSTTGEIREKANSLFERLTNFTNYISGCCNGIVSEEMQRRQEQGMDDAEHEYRDLKKLKVECGEWIHTATLLLEELIGGAAVVGLYKPVLQVESAMSASDKKTDETPDPSVAPTPTTDKAEEKAGSTAAPTPAPSEQTVATTTEPKQEDTVNTSEMQMIGYDKNVRVQSLDQERVITPKEINVEALLKSDGERPDTPNTTRAYEALAAVQALQEKLLNTEERAQNAEEKAVLLEEDLRVAMEKLRMYERKSATPPQTSEGKREEPPQPEPEEKEEPPKEEPPKGESPKGKTKTKEKEKEKEKEKAPATPTHMPPPSPSSAKRPTSSQSVKSTGEKSRSPSQASNRSAASSRASRTSKKSKQS
ncbi:axonemal dynein light chain domain-containing protein 1-like isoform X2 [Ptychodera flava]|uniref:axonemal dynein light chain domain-containing protein 1-like isoform X2 n=1 Tax=Ptychodera flava TaxID=63121 RepID=UPI003969D88F